MPEGDIASGLRVMLVEDDVAFQNAFTLAVASASDMALQAVASTVRQALDLMNEPAPDVLVVDLGMPDGSGLEVIAAAHGRWPDCAIMVSTTFADQDHVIRSIESGASGYLLKDSAADKIADEIRCIFGGGSPISPRIARQLMMRFRKDPPAPVEPDIKAQAAPLHQALSDREGQTLELIAKGFSYDEIADLMGVSRNTVMTFVRRIYTKLEVRSKTEAIFEARNQGLI